MEEGRVMLIGNETDVLHCGFSHAISEGGKRYPSADHYAHAQMLHMLGLDDVHILELLATPSCDVPVRARQLLQENMPPGHDMNSLASYLQASRQSYTLQGLRLRVAQDSGFEKALIETRDALLIVCDQRDSEMAIGMDEQSFIDWMRAENVSVEMLGYWMRNERARPPTLGCNRLALLLMWLRHELKTQRLTALLRSPREQVEGISTDGKDSQPIQLAVSDLVLALQGIFRPLSNLFALRFEMKGEKYRSVEHYAYQRLFEALRLDDKCIEKLRTTVHPSDVRKVAERVIAKQEGLAEGVLESKMARLDRWRQSAMKHKIGKSEWLQQLLVSTGDAVLVETADGDPDWTVGCEETELQHLLSKQYMAPRQLIAWMRERERRPCALAHLGANKTGLLLMELRSRLFTANSAVMPRPLISPPASPALRSILSPHMICFTAESIFHPLCPAEIRIAADDPKLFPSPMHAICQHAIKYFGLGEEDAEWISSGGGGAECWRRLEETLSLTSFPSGVDRLERWTTVERVVATRHAMQCLFEQHPSLLRTLLDTGDSLLVFCSRFATLDLEWTIGMRERDLRAWLAHLDIDTKQLLELTQQGLRQRPAFLGGNRLGIVLMELRREFILRGIFPQQLPELSMPLDAVLGTDSPAENYVPSVQFDPLDLGNYTALWANPYLLLAKHSGNTEMWQQANSVKTAPQLIAIDDPKKAALVDLESVSIDADFLDKCELEELQQIFLRVAARVRNLFATTRQQQTEMDYLNAEIARVQRQRRDLEQRQFPYGGIHAAVRNNEPRVSGGRDERRRPSPRRPPPPPARRASPPPRRAPSPQLQKRPPTPPPAPPAMSRVASAKVPSDGELSEGEILSD